MNKLQLVSGEGFAVFVSLIFFLVTPWLMVILFCMANGLFE